MSENNTGSNKPLRVIRKRRADSDFNEDDPIAYRFRTAEAIIYQPILAMKIVISER
jgi:hypothetical protein